LTGSRFVRMMALMKLGDGRIVIHSAISLEDRDMHAIERWGEPAFWSLSFCSEPAIDSETELIISYHTSRMKDLPDIVRRAVSNGP
jgi:hypothetical protein